MRKKTKAAALAGAALMAALIAAPVNAAAARETGYTLIEFQGFESGVWEFVPGGGAAVERDNSGVGGNVTGKLKMTGSGSGARIITKTLAVPVGGARIKLEFDWYPGALAPKGANNPYENSAELRIRDGADNVIFALNQTPHYPLAYYFGPDPNGGVNNFDMGQLRQSTGFDRRTDWYHAAVVFDNETNTASLTLENLSSHEVKTWSQPIDFSFSGTVKSFVFGGTIRSSGVNMNITTYLDNFSISHVAVPPEVIFSVDPLPYKTIHVGEASSDISSIGLPATVRVRLADGSSKEAPVVRWASDGGWNPAAGGVYAFTGTLAASEGAVNRFNRTAAAYVYNRLPGPPEKTARQAEWLDRGLAALGAAEGEFVSWRLLADEYEAGLVFNLYRNKTKLNSEPLRVTGYLDRDGKPGDIYTVEALGGGASVFSKEVAGLAADYLPVAMQIPPPDTSPVFGTTAGYYPGPVSVGDADGDGEYELFVKWVPENSMDSSFSEPNNQTIFDCYKLNGDLLWRMHLGNNLSSGAHYNQFLVADFDGDGRAEFFVKTADGAAVFGASGGKVDYAKVIARIGDPAKDGAYMGRGAGDGARGHVFGGPEYVSVFRGASGEVIDTIPYRFGIADNPVETWGDTWYNRSDRFLAALAYLDGERPSAVLCRGYYARTTLVQYTLEGGKLVEGRYYDSAENRRIGENRGAHSLAAADVDNDGRDEIIYGSITFDDDLTVLYDMDGTMGRVKGSHGDAIHAGAFSPYNGDAIIVMMPHEDPPVASLEIHHGGSGETLQAYYAHKDTGRGVAANLTANPGFEFWGAGGNSTASGGGVYNVTGSPALAKPAGLSQNFTVYWDGDLLSELLDNITITKVEGTGPLSVNTLKTLTGAASNNGTKAVPCLTADILGDWREEIIMRSEDNKELRIYSTTVPTDYRIYTLMHDPVYRLGAARQNVAYNQPNHLGFYIGEDEAGKARVISETLPVSPLRYPAKPE
jgi:hypothetical protein